MGFRMESHFSLEVQAGFEPADNGVADRGLTTWLLHQTHLCFVIIANLFGFVNRKKIIYQKNCKKVLKSFKIARFSACCPKDLRYIGIFQVVFLKKVDFLIKK